MCSRGGALWPATGARNAQMVGNRHQSSTVHFQGQLPLAHTTKGPGPTPRPVGFLSAHTSTMPFSHTFPERKGGKIEDKLMQKIPL